MFSIPTRRLIQFCQRVATSTKAGVDARRLWTSEANYGSATHRRHVEQIKNRVLAGSTVADGMRDAGDYFPPLTVQMVTIGEQTGKLDEVLFRLAEYYEHQASMRRMFLLGIAWPAFQLTIAVVLMGVLIWAFGWAAEMSGGEPFDVLGIGLVGTSGMLIYFSAVITIVMTLIVLGYAVSRGLLGTKPMLLAMRIPVIGRCLEAFALARLTWTLATALDSGMDARRSAEMALNSTQNIYYLAQRDTVSQAIVRGEEFHEAFGATRAFPEDFLQSLATAELAGATTESLLRLTKEYEDKARGAMRILTIASTAFVFMLVGFIIILLIFRLFFMYLNTINDALYMIDHPNG
jgi:type II secretory pathway component PulF